MVTKQKKNGQKCKGNLGLEFYHGAASRNKLIIGTYIDY